jgi:hypothetical protein
VFGVFHEECGAKLVFREKAKTDCSQNTAAWGKEETDALFTTRGEIPLDLGYAQTYGMGASGAAMVKLLPSGSITDVSGA